MTFTAIRPLFGIGSGREIALFRVSSFIAAGKLRKSRFEEPRR